MDSNIILLQFACRSTLTRATSNRVGLGSTPR
jgi:hypothetical protein